MGICVFVCCLATVDECHLRKSLFHAWPAGWSLKVTSMFLGNFWNLRVSRKIFRLWDILKDQKLAALLSKRRACLDLVISHTSGYYLCLTNMKWSRMNRCALRLGTFRIISSHWNLICVHLVILLFWQPLQGSKFCTLLVIIGVKELQLLSGRK